MPTGTKQSAPTDSLTYSLDQNLDQNNEQFNAEQARHLVALSHTPNEHRIYSAMLSEISAASTRVGSFSARQLMSLTGINGYSTLRRGLGGLVNKLSIERQKVAGADGFRYPRAVYLIFGPEEILERRRAAGVPLYPKEFENAWGGRSSNRVLRRVVHAGTLSRREAQVVLWCAEGLTNAEIGAELRIGEQTVKFHLRNIFRKLGLRRRTELISRLLRDDAMREVKTTVL